MVEEGVVLVYCAEVTYMCGKIGTGFLLNGKGCFSLLTDIPQHNIIYLLQLLLRCRLRISLIGRDQVLDTQHIRAILKTNLPPINKFELNADKKG